MHWKLFAAALVFAPFLTAHAASDYYLKIDGVEGESAAAAPAVTTTAALSTTTYGIVGKPFVLDGSKSVDDGVVRSFSWRQVSGPTVRPADPKSSTLSVTPSTAGTYVFELVVTDAAGLSSVARSFKVVVEDQTPLAASTTTVAPPPQPPQEASTDYLLKIPPIDGESAKGKVETGWKVEEGEKAAVPGVEPDEIDVNVDPEPVTPDFSILLGGGGTESSAEGEAKVAEILLQGMQEADMPAEQVSLNYGKIKTKIAQPLKLFGFIPVSVSAEVEIDVDRNVKVRFPWWSFLATGKDEAGLGSRVFTAVSNVLKTKHDTVKNSINNVR